MGNGIRDHLKFPLTEMIVETDFWENQLHPDDKERVINKLNQVFENGKLHHWEDQYRFKNNEGKYRYIFSRGFIIYRYALPVRMAGLMEDVTAKIELEKNWKQKSYSAKNNLQKR